MAPGAVSLGFDADGKRIRNKSAAVVRSNISGDQRSSGRFRPVNVHRTGGGALISSHDLPGGRQACPRHCQATPGIRRVRPTGGCRMWKFPGCRAASKPGTPMFLSTQDRTDQIGPTSRRGGTFADLGGCSSLACGVPEPRAVRNRPHLDVNAGGPPGTPPSDRHTRADEIADKQLASLSGATFIIARTE